MTDARICVTQLSALRRSSDHRLRDACWREFHDLVYRMARQALPPLGVHQEDIQDIVHVVLFDFRGQLARRRLAATRSPSAYLCRCLVNASHRTRRRRMRFERVQQGLLPRCLDSERPPDTSTVSSILTHLSLTEVEVLRWRVIDGASVDQIATRLGTTRCAAAARVRRAIAKAREAADSARDSHH